MNGKRIKFYVATLLFSIIAAQTAGPEYVIFGMGSLLFAMNIVSFALIRRDLRLQPRTIRTLIVILGVILFVELSRMMLGIRLLY